MEILVCWILYHCFRDSLLRVFIKCECRRCYKSADFIVKYMINLIEELISYHSFLWNIMSKVPVHSISVQVVLKFVSSTSCKSLALWEEYWKSASKLKLCLRHSLLMRSIKWDSVSSLLLTNLCLLLLPYSSIPSILLLHLWRYCYSTA